MVSDAPFSPVSVQAQLRRCAPESQQITTGVWRKQPCSCGGHRHYLKGFGKGARHSGPCDLQQRLPMQVQSSSDESGPAAAAADKAAEAASTAALAAGVGDHFAASNRGDSLAP